jgi:hypothetical protein
MEKTKRLYFGVLGVLVIAVLAIMLVFGTGLTNMAGEALGSPEKCTDSDGGNNIDVSGTVTYYAQGKSEPTTLRDKCNDSKFVYEYTCKGTKVAGQRIGCGYMCQSGRCIPVPACSDTDGGKNATVYGVVTYYVGGTPITLPDSCYANKTVKEAYCYNSTFGTYTGINCTGNMNCTGGRCR